MIPITQFETLSVFKTYINSIYKYVIYMTLYSSKAYKLRESI